jgi:hypothetical protein
MTSDINHSYPEDMYRRKTETSVLRRLMIQCLRGSDNVAVLLPPRQEAGDEHKNP